MRGIWRLLWREKRPMILCTRSVFDVSATLALTITLALPIRGG